MKVVNWNLKKLKSMDYNPNEMSKKEFEQLKTSLKKYEAVEPIIVNVNPKRKGNIIGGHHRKKAALELGWKEFPCVEVSLTEKKEKELNLRLNKNRGQFNIKGLKKFEKNLLLEIGFNFKDLDSIFKNTNTEPAGEKFEKMELQPYESYDYIVLLFRDSFDWVNACQKLGLKNVNYSQVEKVKKIGIGRVVDGKDAFQKIANKKKNT